jgi:hypothetical protein
MHYAQRIRVELTSAFANYIYGLFLITLSITIITLIGMESAD